MTAAAIWPRKRLKYSCEVNPCAPSVSPTQEVTFLPMEAIGERGGIDTSATRVAAQVRQGYTGFVEGDVLIAKITPCFENGKGAIATGLANGVGFGTTELHVLRPTHCDARWLFYVTQSREFMGYGEGSMYGAGGQKRVPPEFVKNFVAPTPTLSEQLAIVGFLDRKTAAVDALIAKKERLIGLLQEKRQALITQAVTKGLDPKVPTKASGIVWLGQIPQHWTLCRMKDVVLPVGGIQMGPFGAQLKNLVPNDTGFKLYGQENTISGNFLSGSRWLTPGDFERLSYYRLLPGDVVLTRKGASIGNCRLVPEGIQPGCADSDTIRVRFASGQIHTEFAVLLMHEGYLEEEIQYSRRGSVLPGLNTRTIANLRVALPPIGEQHRLLSELNKRLATVDRNRASTTRSVEVIREYRQALVTAAVTGKLDVSREAAA